MKKAIENENVQRPAGRIETPSRESNVRFVGEASSVSELANLVVADRDGAPVRLKDVAIVQDGLEDVRMVARSKGMPALGFRILKQRGANAVEVTRRIREKVAEIKAELKRTDPDLDIFIPFDSAKNIEESISEVQFTLVLSILLTGAVCWLFLASVGSAVNILLAIPMSILGTFGVMYFAGFTMNMFTLLALSLAVGIVVDDAIMVLENVYRHGEKGEDRKTAASKGAHEIAFAALAASAALISIFLPIAFIGGIIGKFLFQFGITLSVAVAISYLDAITLTPTLCGQFLAVEKGHERRGFGRLLDDAFRAVADFYRRILVAILPGARSLLVLAGAVLFFVGTIAMTSNGAFGLTRPIGVELVPGQDQGNFLVNIQAPIGSSLESSRTIARECERFMLAQPEILHFFLIVGSIEGSGDADAIMMFVTLVPQQERPGVSQTAVMNRVSKAFNTIPGIKAIPIDLSRMAFSSSHRASPIEFTIRGPELKVLAELSTKFQDALNASGLAKEADSDYRAGKPEIPIRPLRDRAADLGVSVEEIANTLNSCVAGVKSGRITLGGRRYDIRLRLVRDERMTPTDLGALYVRTDQGNLVPLSAVTAYEEKPTLQVINRVDRERCVTIYANVNEGRTQGEGLALVESLAPKLLPSGYRIEVGGTAKTFQEGQKGTGFVFLLGIAVVYILLAAQFNALLDPFTVLLTLPFAISGALMTLWITGNTLNLYSMIGIILLMGIVLKNGILLVDFARQRREAGVDPEQAILEAGPIRLRPILMTTIATMAGAVPAAIGTGAGSELRVPMAMAVLGGLTVSTLLTLLVVPAFLKTTILIRHAADWILGRRPPPAPAATPAAGLSANVEPPYLQPIPPDDAAPPPHD